jgi:uncharacterized iron-regulated membrane protein
MRERSLWLSLHKWLGIALGTWFALVGLSGAVLVFEDPVDAWLNPDLLTTTSRGPRLPPEEIVERARNSPGLAGVERVRLPIVDGEVYRLQLRTAPSRGGRQERVEATFDPVSGALLGTRGTETMSLAPRHLLRTVYEFHRNVLLGTTGSNIVGIAGFALLASAVTGLVLAIPKKRSGWAKVVWVNLRASATRIVYDLHRSVGAVFLALLLLTTITGATLVYLNYVRDLVSVFSKVATFPTIPWVKGSRDDLTPFAQVVGAVRTAYPEHTITEIHLPLKVTAGYLFYLRRPQCRRDADALALSPAQRHGLRHAGHGGHVPDRPHAAAAGRQRAVGVAEEAARRAHRREAARAASQRRTGWIAAFAGIPRIRSGTTRTRARMTRRFAKTIQSPAELIRSSAG